jgi:hypothetical protein
VASIGKLAAAQTPRTPGRNAYRPTPSSASGNISQEDKAGKIESQVCLDKV